MDNNNGFFNKDRITIAFEQPVILDWMHKRIHKCFNNRYDVSSSPNDKIYQSNINDPKTFAIFLDVETYGIMTIGMITKLREKFPKKRVIVFSMHSVNPDDIRRYIYWGAFGFLNLIEKDDVINEQLKCCVEGKICYTMEIIRCIKEYEELTKKPPYLTDTEIEVVRCIAKGMPVKKIGAVFNRKKKTIENHITNIHRKFNVFNSVDMLKLAVSFGILPIEEIMAFSTLPEKDEDK